MAIVRNPGVLIQAPIQRDSETFPRILVCKDRDIEPLFEEQRSAGMIPVSQQDHFQGGNQGEFLDRRLAQLDRINKINLPVDYVRA
jgi:hypothetical protein